MKLLSALRRNPPLALDLLAGAAAGAIGAYLMTPAQQAVTKLQGASAQKREKKASLEKNATQLTAERIAGLFGKRLKGDALTKASYAVHYGYGIVQGVAFAIASRKLRSMPKGAGLLFGAALWLFGDELAVPLLELSSLPQKFPASSHVKALAAHLAYGAGLEGSFRAARAVGA